MVHLRIVAPADRAEQVHALLCATGSAIDVIRVPNASTRPDGDLIMCDVAREDASVIICDLRELGIHHDGLDLAQPTERSRTSPTPPSSTRPGSPADAVIWEELDQRTSESVELSGVFLLYMVLAAIIAAIGIFLDSPILVVGAMVVGPEFGPVAGLCVALVQRRAELARRSALALAVGFPLGDRRDGRRDAALRRRRPGPRRRSTPTDHALAEEHLEPGRVRVHRRRSAPAPRACSASRRPSPAH